MAKAKAKTKTKGKKGKAGSKKDFRKKREKKNVPVGVVHITATFNNTVITITDMLGNTLAWATSGSIGRATSRTISGSGGEIPEGETGISYNGVLGGGDRNGKTRVINQRITHYGKQEIDDCKRNTSYK